MKEYKTSFEERYRKSNGAKMRREGKGVLVPGGPVVERVHQLSRYIPLVRIAKETGIPVDTISNWVYKDHIGKAPRIYRMYADRIMNYELPDDATTSQERILGAQRIYRGLAVRGFGMPIICGMLGMKVDSFKNIVCEGKHVKRGFSPEAYRELVKIAGKLETQNPYDLNTPRGVNGTKGKAREAGWTDIGAWDLDTIHRLDEQPNVTGLCDRLSGALIHLREGQPLCDACQARVNNPRNVVDIYKLYEVYQLDLSHAESAQLLGIGKDLYSQYAQYLRPEERKIHTLSMVDKLAMTGYCDACRDQVQLYRQGPSKLVCANGVRKYREEKGL